MKKFAAFALSVFTVLSIMLSGSSSDKLPSGYSVTTPSSSSQSSIRSKVTSTKNNIKSYCKANKIPSSLYFDALEPNSLIDLRVRLFLFFWEKLIKNIK